MGMVGYHQFTWSNGGNNFCIDFIAVNDKFRDYLNITSLYNFILMISLAIYYLFFLVKKKKKKKKKHHLTVLLHHLLLRKLNDIVEFVGINMKQFSLIIIFSYLLNGFEHIDNLDSIFI